MDRRFRLLLIEDEDVLRMLVAQFLRAEGFTVVEAIDGDDGVNWFDAEGPFDLLLVDLNLPNRSGVEVCRHVRQAQPSQKILVCSAAITEEHERALREIGVDQMMTKPYHPEALIARIHRLVESHSTAIRMAPSTLLSPVGMV